jgi:trehalose 6-phosphate synthase
MNLVAKEFVSARDDERGVLILSQFAGAARELTAALIVNPYAVDQSADALARALTMSDAEESRRMATLRSVVMEFSAYRWAGQLLSDGARLRVAATPPLLERSDFGVGASSTNLHAFFGTKARNRRGLST